MCGNLILVVLLGMHLHFFTCYAVELQTFKVASSLSNEQSPRSCWGLESTITRKCGVIPNVNTQGLPSYVAGFGEFPWQVAIIDRYEETFKCSGVLIGSRTVLTSTICVGDMMLMDIRVRVGEWDIMNERSAEEPFGSEDIPVVKKYFYSDFGVQGSSYSLAQEAYNIAILKLKHPVNFDVLPHVIPVCLPNADVNYTSLTNCYVAGWGNSPVDGLQMADREVVPTTSRNEPIIESNNYCIDGFSVKTADETFCLSAYLSSFNNEASLSHSSLDLKSGNGNVDVDRDSTVETEEDGRIEATDKTTVHKDEGTEATDKTPTHEDMSFEGEQSPTEGSVENEPYVTMSRVLNMAAVSLASRTDCISRTMNETKLKSTQICVFSEENSQLCKADVGSPVVCEMKQPIPLQKKTVAGYHDKHSKSLSWKANKKFKDAQMPLVTQYIVVAIVSQSHPCTEQKMPLVAVSVPRMMDFICRVAEYGL